MVVIVVCSPGGLMLLFVWKPKPKCFFEEARRFEIFSDRPSLSRKENGKGKGVQFSESLSCG